MSQKVLLKIKLGNDMRRITLDEKPSYSALVALLNNLLAEDLNSQTFVIKYIDDENDLITITHDREVSEAWEFAMNSGSARPLLRLVIEKKSPVPSVPQAQEPSAKGKEKVEETEKTESQLPPVVENVLNIPEVQQIMGAFNINAEDLKPCLSFLNPLLAGLNADQNNTTQTTSTSCGSTPSSCCSSSSEEEKPVHNATCDGCNNRIVGTRYKCSECPDFDLCEQCFPNRDKIHTQGHSFAVMMKPLGHGMFGGPRRPMVHRAFCDVCSQRIVGTRYKCNECDDYDLCEKCISKAKEVHNATHTFNTIAWAPWGRGGHGGHWGHGGHGQGQGHGFWGRRCGAWKRHCSGNSATGTEGTSSAGNATPSGCPMFRRHGGFAEKYQARYISDETYPDGALVAPGKEFVKIWKIKNIGNVAWPENTRLVYVCGDTLTNGEGAVVVPALAPGEEVCVSVDMVAPTSAGRYVSNFRLITPEGFRFGHRVWVDITVPATSEAEETKEVKVELENETDEEQPRAEESIPDSDLYEEAERALKIVEVQEEPKVEVKQEEPKVEVISDELKETDPQYAALKQLADIGFTQHEVNRVLLLEHSGNIQSVIEALLSM